MRILGKFVINLALPALIIRSLAHNSFFDIFNASYLAAYLIGTTATITLGYVWYRALTRQEPLAGTFHVMGMSCANSGFIGYPILLLVFPTIAGSVLALNMLAENLLIIPFFIYMAERGRDQNAGISAVVPALSRLIYNPVVIGIFVGAMVSLIGLPLPQPLMKTIDLLAAASGAASLIVIGGSLVGAPLKHNYEQVAPTVFGKLFLHPFLVWTAISLLPVMGMDGLESRYQAAAIIMAATPMMGIYPTLAQAYGREGSSALNMLTATLFSFVTLSCLLWIISSWLG